MKRVLLAMFIMLSFVGAVVAQEATPVATTPGSTFQVFAVICADAAVINLTGTATTGRDLYYQVFSGNSGAGTPLTSVRQVSVNGTFAVSDRVSFNAGQTVGAGAFGAVEVWVGVEGNTTRPSTGVVTVQDAQDGCNNAQNPLVSSVDTGVSGGIIPTPSGSNVPSPFGGNLNPGLEVTEEPAVVIGARSTPVPIGRTANPGLIFAECDDYLPGASPGVVYDTDNVVIYWTWYARTLEQIQAHQVNANYSVRLNTARFLSVNASEPTRRGSDYYIFYTVNIGNLLAGHYEVEYKLNWDLPISDGYQDFGVGTANPQELSLCNFDVVNNPFGLSPNPSGIYNPTDGPVHDLRSTR